MPFLSDTRLSPDGQRIAARMFGPDHARIGIWRLDAPRETPPELLDVGEFDDITWAGNSRLLITRMTVQFVSFANTYYLGPALEILVKDLAGKTTRIVPGRRIFASVIFIDPLGRYALVSAVGRNDDSPAVLRVDLDSGEMVEVQPAIRGVWAWFADARGQVRVGIDYGERLTRIHYRPGQGGPMRRLETRRHLLLDTGVVDLVHLGPQGDRGLMISNGETGRFTLYEYDFATDTRGAVLFEHPQVDADAPFFGPDGAVLGVTWHDDQPRVRWLDPNLERVQAQLDRALLGRTNRILEFASTGNRLLLFSFAPNDPGTYYVFDRSSRRLEIFASPFDALQGHAFAETRPVRYRSRDGLDINGYLTLPRGVPGTNLPLIVLPHGGPFLRDLWGFDPEVQFLAARGYAVLQANFRGSTGYGREFVERGYGQLGNAMIDDIDDAAQWAVTQGIADRGRICIMGSSYGGYAAIWAAMRSPTPYRCAISWAGPTDLAAIARRERNFFVADRYQRERRRQLRGDEEIRLRDISPLRFPERLNVPLLLGHGQNDETVPLAQGRDFARALERRSTRNFESIFYPKAGHGFTDPIERADFLRRIDVFLSRHNPADPGAQRLVPGLSNREGSG